MKKIKPKTLNIKYESKPVVMLYNTYHKLPSNIQKDVINNMIKFCAYENERFYFLEGQK